MIDYGLKGRVALITGVNNPQGIGAATALAFAREGAKLVLVYKKVDRLFDRDKTGKNGVDRYYAANAGDADQLESMLREMDAEYLILESDISDEDAVKEIYAAAFDRFGRVDILVNNAAVDDENGLDTIENITPKVIDDTFAVNVRGSILMIRELVSHRGDFGRVINLSTDAAQVFAGQITYGASKATLEALTRSIALEVAKYGITVNSVAPGLRIRSCFWQVRKQECLRGRSLRFPADMPSNFQFDDFSNMALYITRRIKCPGYIFMPFPAGAHAGRADRCSSISIFTIAFGRG